MRVLCTEADGCRRRAGHRGGHAFASSELDIPGLEKGRRVERVEWGNSTERADFREGAGVSPAESESQARYRAEQTYYGHRGPYRTPVVRRTVVTFTTPWEREPDLRDVHADPS